MKIATNTYSLLSVASNTMLVVSIARLNFAASRFALVVTPLPPPPPKKKGGVGVGVGVGMGGDNKDTGGWKMLQ